MTMNKKIIGLLLSEDQLPKLVCPSCRQVIDGAYAVEINPRTRQRRVWHNCWSCRTRSWDGKPMVSRQTLRARAEAHKYFDPLWQSQSGMSEAETRTLLARSQAYDMLAEELGIDYRPHFSDADYDLAIQVPAAVDRIRERLAARTEEQIRLDYRQRGKEIAAARKLRRGA